MGKLSEFIMKSEFCTKLKQVFLRGVFGLGKRKGKKGGGFSKFIKKSQFEPNSSKF